MGDQFAEALKLHQTGDVQRAEAMYRAILGREPSHAGAWHLLGVACLQTGRNEEAAISIRTAISFDKTKSPYFNNLGVALRSLGKLSDALSVCHEALRLRPDYADAHSNLGLVLAEMGKPAQAAQAFEKALQIQPNHADALFNLGCVCQALDRGAEAVRSFERAIAAQPNRAETHNNLGNALLALRKPDEALASYQRALQLAPANAEARLNLGIVLAEKEEIEQAAAAFQSAVVLCPERPGWRLRELGLCPTIFGSERELDEYRTQLESKLDECLSLRRSYRNEDELMKECVTPPFNLAHHGRDNRRLVEKFATLHSPHVRHEHLEARTGKPRIGFVVASSHESGFLRMLGGIVEHLDPERFEVAIVCTTEGIRFFQSRFRRTDLLWVPLPSRITRAIETVKAAACDVLHFFKASADPLSYLLSMARLAPVQCTSWATHLTSGIREIDYYVSSDLIEVPGSEHQYTERLVRLRSLATYEVRPSALQPATRADFGLPATGSIYLAPQRLAKFHPAQDELFRGILDADPTGHLVMLEPKGSEKNIQRLVERFQRTLGTAAQRVIRVPPQSPDQFRRLLSIGDALLDMRHYSASLMAYDAFAVDLPIVTLPGQLKVERYSHAFYARMGVAGPIATTSGEYIAMAIRLGKDRDYREHLRGQIAAHKHLLFEKLEVVHEYERFFENAIATARKESR